MRHQRWRRNELENDGNEMLANDSRLKQFRRMPQMDRAPVTTTGLPHIVRVTVFAARRDLVPCKSESNSGSDR
jgi:hypothetical protein